MDTSAFLQFAAGLESRFDDVLFAEVANAKGQKPSGNMRRSMMGLIPGGPLAMPATMSNASDLEKEGIVYRKRDAVADSDRMYAGLAGGQLAGMGAGALGGHLLREKILSGPNPFSKKMTSKAAGHMERGLMVAHLAPKVAGLAGLIGGGVGGYQWAKHRNARRIAEAKQPS